MSAPIRFAIAERQVTSRSRAIVFACERLTRPLFTTDQRPLLGVERAVRIVCAGATALTCPRRARSETPRAVSRSAASFSAASFSAAMMLCTACKSAWGISVMMRSAARRAPSSTPSRRMRPDPNVVSSRRRWISTARRLPVFPSRTNACSGSPAADPSSHVPPVPIERPDIVSPGHRHRARRRQRRRQLQQRMRETPGNLRFTVPSRHEKDTVGSRLEQRWEPESNLLLWMPPPFARNF